MERHSFTMSLLALPKFVKYMDATINHIHTFPTAVNYNVKDTHGVLQRYGLENEDCLQFCGGIPRADLMFINVSISSATQNTLQVAVDTDWYQAFRTINYISRRISNDNLRVYHKEEGVGTALFLNQVIFAREYGFRKLSAFAMERDMGERVEGYYRWARLGYQMTDRNDLDDFSNLMKYAPFPAKTLSELVLDDAGYAFWREQGFDWTGEFLLKDGSPSMNHLEKYLALKGINVLL